MQGQNPNRREGHRKETGDDPLFEQTNRFVEGIENIGHVAVTVDITGGKQRADHTPFVHKELGEDKIFVITLNHYHS